MAEPNDWLIGIGIEPDEAQINEQMQAIYNEIAKVLNQKYSLNIDPTNIEQIQNAIKTFGINLNATTEVGTNNIRNITASFADTNNTVVTLTTSLKQVALTMDSINQLGDRFTPIGNPYNTLDSDGNSLTMQNGIVTTSTVGVYENTNALLREYNQNLRDAETLTNKLRETEQKGSQNLASAYKAELEQLSQRRVQIENIINDEERLAEIRRQVSQETAASTLQSMARIDDANSAQDYREILSIEKEIEQLRIKQISAGEQEKANLQSQIDLRLRDIEEIQNRNRLTDEHLKQLSQIETKQNTDVGNKEQDAYLTQFNNNLKEQLKITQQINKLDADSNQNYIKILTEKRSNLESVNKTLKSQITNQEKVNKLEEEHNKLVKESDAQKSDKDDNAKIQEAINLNKQLLNAQKELYELQAKKAPAQDLEGQRQEVNRLKTELDEATKAQLSNNTAVQDSQKYVDATTAQYRDYEEQIRKVNASNQQSVGILGSVTSNFKSVASQATATVTSLLSFSTIQKTLTQVINTVKELDDSMTQVRLVTGQSGESARQTMNDYAALAKELGVTTKSVAEGSLEWLRQGKTAEETMKLLKSSTMLSKLGAMESSDATEKLTSIINSYKLSVEDATTVVDKLVGVDLIAATSTEELSTALQRSASFAASAGVSFDKMIGLIGTVSETTRLSAETINKLVA